MTLILINIKYLWFASHIKDEFNTYTLSDYQLALSVSVLLATGF